MSVVVQKWEFDPTYKMEQEAVAEMSNGNETTFEEDDNEEILF